MIGPVGLMLRPYEDAWSNTQGMHNMTTPRNDLSTTCMRMN